MAYLRDVPAEGRILTAAQAAPILNYFNITADTWIDSVEGQTVDYAGKVYWIGQGEYPISGGSRPDGWHFVYEKSAAEIAAGQPDKPFDWNSLVWLAGVGIAAYVAVNFFGKKAV
jgi:hypothetical protein